MGKRKWLGKKRKGFMLIELIIVIAIVGILAAVAVPNLVGMTNEAKVAKIQADLSTIGTAAEVYYVKNGKYPASLSDLVGDNDNAYLKNLPDPPDKESAYTLGNKGEVTCTFNGTTYSSYGTSSKSGSSGV